MFTTVLIPPKQLYHHLHKLLSFNDSELQRRFNFCSELVELIILGYEYHEVNPGYLNKLITTSSIDT